MQLAQQALKIIQEKKEKIKKTQKHRSTCEFHSSITYYNYQSSTENTQAVTQSKKETNV